jgi:hypothetical protein
LVTELGQIPRLLDRNQQEPAIRVRLATKHNMEHWQGLKDRVQRYDDPQLSQKLSDHLTALKNGINGTEKKRKEIVDKNIPDIYSWNEAMREFVKGKTIHI